MGYQNGRRATSAGAEHCAPEMLLAEAPPPDGHGVLCHGAFDKEERMQETVPFTSHQRELWLAANASLSAYAETAIRVCFPVEKALDPELLVRATGLALRRTPLAGGALLEDGKEPRFALGANPVPDFRIIDARGQADPKQAAGRALDAFFEEPVNTPLIRYALVRDSDSADALALKCSHLVFDGLGVFAHVSRIAEMYSALARGEAPDPGEPLSCAAAHAEDAAHRASPRHAKDMAFWENWLARLPEKRIFRALPGRGDITGTSRHKKYILAEDACRAVAAAAAGQGVSPAVCFTALHALVVAFMTGEKELVLQTPVAFGGRKAFDRQGAQVATAPVFVALHEHASPASLFKDIAAQNARFFRHIRTPYQEAMRRLEGKDFSCLADTFLNFLPNCPAGTDEFPILGCEQRHSAREPVLFGAMVLREPRTERFSLTVRSSRNHFSAQDADRYVKRMEHVARQLARGAVLSDIDYLLDEEKRELSLWQQGETREYPVEPLPELFDRAAARFADRPAVRDEAGEELSYAQVREHSLRCAAWLAEQGVGRGDIVAVLGERAACLPEIILGIQRCGAAYLPVDPNAPAARRALILADAGARLTLEPGNSAYRQRPCAKLPPAPASEDGAYLIYTSGSTGRPKGVLVPHGGFANMIQGQIEIFGLGKNDRVLQFAPPGFDASLSEIFMALLAGACLYPVSDALREAPWGLQRYMADNGITVATFPPSYLNLFDGEPFPGLRVLITAGEPPVAGDSLRYAQALRCFNAYGPTEACVCASIQRVSPAGPLPISAGRPLPNVSLSIRDKEERPLPAGMVGELWIGGKSLARGYHNRPELTKARFRPPFAGGGIAYATGDLASWSEGGELLLAGRADDQVKIRGNRVEPGEAACLLERCPGVSQAFVLAVKDEAGRASLAAFLVLAPGAACESVMLQSSEHLPGYMVPSAWHVLKTMPVTASGKVDRKALQRLMRQEEEARKTNRKTDGEADREANREPGPESCQTPGPAAELRLLDIFSRALGRACDPDKDFFVQGGNSLSAMSVLREISNTFNVDIAFRDFAACETPARVASLVAARLASGVASCSGASGAREAAPVCREAPLSQSQFPLWAYQQANDRSIDYNMPLLLEARGERAESFFESLCAALNEQELFACVIDGEIDNPYFALRAGAATAVRRESFADAAGAMAFFEELIHSPFDLRKEPPVRLAAAQLPHSLQILVLAHHIAADGETLDILVDNALKRLRGKRSTGGLLATQAAFCRRQSAFCRSAAWEEDAAYWRALLSPPVAPWGSAGGSATGTENAGRGADAGAVAAVELSPGLAAGLESLAERGGGTLLACFAALTARFLCERYGREEVLIGTPVGLRETREEFETAGFFVNTTPLRLARGTQKDLAAAIGKTAEQLRRAAAHSRYCDIPSRPEFLVAHARPETIAADDLTVKRMSPPFRGRKFAAAFTLESGDAPRLLLEHDREFIPDGPAFLNDFMRELERACASPLSARSPRSPRHILAEAWRDILHNGQGAGPTEHSIFLQDGGDSIKAIQMTGILHRNGITALAAPDFLRSPRFTELCALLDAAGNGPAREEATYPALAAEQKVPLLPFQQFFINAHPDHWKTCLMPLPLDIGPDIPTAALEAWLAGLPEQYEALRLAFFADHAVALRVPQAISLRRLKAGGGAALPDILPGAVRLAGADIDPERGKTLGAVLVSQAERRLLLLVGHHLILDVFSLEVLRRDCLHYCRTGTSLGEAHGVAARAMAVEAQVAAGAFPTPQDREFWSSLCATPAAGLVARVPGAKDRAVERTSLHEKVTGFDPANAPSIRADLLSTLARALHRQGQRNAVFLTLESHGRDDLLPGFDASQSLGWFTAVCPLPLQPVPSRAEAEKTLIPRLDSHCTPRNCNAYGYLRREDAARFGYKAQIAFNYLGWLAAGRGEEVALLPDAALPGAAPELLAPDFEPDCPLDLTLFFDAAGVLHLTAWFSPKVLPFAWVTGLLNCWRDELHALPACVAEETRAAALAASAVMGAEVELLERPDHTREAMLYQSLLPGRGVYTQQVAFSFRGELDEFLLMRAWKAVVARHQSLRSLFPMPCQGEFYRAILREARMSVDFYDLAHLPEAQAGEEIATLLRRQRQRAFDLQKGPLLRAQFFRTGADALTISWCFHHLLMDGWCMGILLDELFTVAESLAGRPAGPLPPPFDVSEYALWRSRFDAPAARAYWASLLEGFVPLTGVARKKVRPDDADPESLSLTLDPALSARVQALAAERSVTLPVLIQALWGIVLSGQNASCRDVVYGLVTSGRPTGLAGIDRAVGLFIRTVPLRVRWKKDASLQDVLEDLREQSLQQMRHGHMPLAEMGGNIFDHLLVFENYPMHMEFDHGRVRLEDIHGFERIPYPLGISVIPGKSLRFRFLYEAAALDRERVLALQGKLHTLLLAVARDKGASCRSLEAAIAGDIPQGSAPDEKAARKGTALPEVAAGAAAGPGGNDAAGGADKGGADENGAIVEAEENGAAAGPGKSNAKDRTFEAIERVVLECYASALGRPVPSTDANFFLLGGHSLLAMRVMAELHKRLGLAVSMEDIMTCPTAGQLAARICPLLAKGVPNALSGAPRNAPSSTPPGTARNATPHTVPSAHAISRAAPGERLALSPAQQRIWFLQRLHEDDRAYLIPFAARLPNDVDRDALQKALILLEERHDALRLRVAGAVPEQTPAPAGSLLLENHDAPYTEDAFQAMSMDFGPDRPLVRAALFHEADKSRTLLLCFHHIIFDGWSGAIFIRELNEAYAAALRGSAPAWQPLELEYGSYAAREAERDVPGVQAAAQALLPLPERLELPLDFPRPARRSFAGKVLAFDLPPEQCRELRRYARDMGLTVFSVLLALVKTFLYRHTGQTDLLIGCPAANRERAHTQDMIGLFVNTLVLRTRLEPEKDFDRLARAVDKALLRALTAQSCPFEKLVEALGVERNAARNPLFDVFVAFEDASWAEFARPPLCMRPLALPHTSSKFDLSVYFKETAQGRYAVHIEYCTALFREDSIRAMADRFITLAGAALRRNGASLAELDILPENERALLASFNATDEDFDIEQDIDALFAVQARATPDAPAVADASGAVCDYAAFDARVAAAAAWLQSRGIGRGEYVGLCYERSLDMLTCIFAILRVGGVYVPLSAALPEARLRSVFEDLKHCAVLCEPRFAQVFADLGQRILTPDVDAIVKEFAGAGASRSELGIDPASVAYVIFTSGSTGRPKGVQIEHRSVCNRLLWMQSRFPLGKGDVVLQKTTTLFDVSVWELFWWSWCGASLALLEPGAEKNPAKIVEAVCRHRVTVLHFVPSMLRAFLEYLALHPQDIPKLASLRYVFTSGEALPRELVEQCNALLDAQLHNLYGPTEATVDVTWQPCLATPPHSVPIGRPISNTRLYVLDKGKRPVPIGVSGEISISGVQVARGYVNRPDLNAAAFAPDPFIPGKRMYRTGDLGRWRPDGAIEYLGRNDDQVKIRGFRIELGEVEAALARCSGVAQAPVRLCRMGGYDALEAFLLPHKGARLSFNAIREELAQWLPEYMWPARLFVADEIPLGASGKADRKNLRGRELLPTATAQSRGAREAVTALRAVWRQVLPQAGDMDENLGFFEAGGNSLLLVRLHALLEEQWPGLFTLAGLFSESSLNAQALVIEQARPQKRDKPGAVDSAAPVAVIGMAVRIGEYEDAERFWDDLARGADKNVPLPERRQRETRQIFEAVGLDYDPARLREAAYLSDISAFDCKRFGLSPLDAALLDPKQRLFLETALRALDDAGYGGAALENEKVGVFVGASPYRLFQDAVTRAFPDQAEQIYLLNVPSNVVARLSHLKNWNGPAAVIDTACSSALAAVHEACRSLRAGECRAALVGAAHIMDIPLKAGRTFSIEAASGKTRSFDAGADGVGAGEGAAVFVLKPLKDAQRDNDAIHAVIAGSAINQDGKSSSMAAPNPQAQAEVILQAAQNASLSLTDIHFFEAHGTATALGDPVEIEALGRAFAREGKALREKALIASVKGNIGHLDAAAGAAGLAKAILSLKKGAVPPQPHFERPNPHIDFEAAPVRVARALEALPPGGAPWRCGVSSFGLSGVNAHVIVCGHAPPPVSPVASMAEDDGSWLCLPFSAADEAGLRAYLWDVREAVARNRTWPLHAVAATLITGREYLPFRSVVTARSRQEFLDSAPEALPVAHCARALPAEKAGAGFASRDAAEEAAGAFLRGQGLFWPEKRPLHRLHLPPTPLCRATLWPAFAEKILAGPVQSPGGSLFSLPLDRPDFWPVSEHRLRGVPTLVGMALPGLIGGVVGKTPLRIKKLQWHAPVTQKGESRACLLLNEKGGESRVELHHCQNGVWGVAASAVVQSGAEAPANLDIAMLRGAMRVFEPQGGQALVNVSGRWRCRESLHMADGGNALLASLRLPDEYRRDMHSFRWHPAMLDIAASLALHGTAGFVPAECREMRLHGPLPAQAWAHVTIKEKHAGLIVANCAVADPSGRVLVEMLGLTFIAVRREGPEAQPPEPVLYALEWAKVSVPEKPAGAEAIVLLGGRGDALGDALAKTARRRFALPGQALERRALAEEMAGAEASHIVYLPEADDSHWAFCDLLREICRIGLRRPLRVTVADSGAFGGGAPEKALVLGPLLCLRREEPLVSCAYAEMPSQKSAARQAFLSSLGCIDGPYRVSEDGEIYIPRLAKPGPTQTRAVASFVTGGCVVITGGLGGMGLTLAEQMATRAGARPVLLHRRAQTPPDLPFAAYRCDVTDAKRVAATFARIRAEIGPIRGVIHAAGVAGGGYLFSRSEKDYAAVLAPKVAGTWNIHETTLGDDLDFFVLASSRTSLTGAPGQSDYTAANAFLNAFARYRTGRGLPALSLCWNAWADVGMAARSGRADMTDSANALPPERALDVLQAALASAADVAVVAMNTEDVAAYRLAVPRGDAPGQEKSLEEEQREGREKGRAAASPADSPEAALLGIFRENLGYESLTRDDDFFDLGGDSIAGTRIVSRIEQELGISLGIADLLESDTLGDFIDRALAARKTAPASGGREPEPAPKRDMYPVGREQLAILYADMAAGGSLGFNLPVFLKLPRDLDKKRLEAAIGELIRRHEALRTSFRDLEAEHPNMVIRPFGGFTLEETRLPDLAAKDAFIVPFDLRRDELFRARLLTVDDGERVLFFDIHHALADGRTISLLNAELLKLYYGLPLAPVTAQQKDFAWRQYTRPNEEDARYWQNIYRGDLPRLDLPAAFARPNVHTGRGGMYEFVLPAELVAGIRALARREGTTAYHVALCAWGILAGAYAGASDVVVAVSMDNRNGHLNTAGMLASLLPLRLDMRPELPLGVLLRETRRVSNEALRHSAYILNDLLADIRPPASPERSLLSEIILSYMNFEFASEGHGLFETLHFDKHAGKTDLSVFGSDTGDSISYALEYYADLFSHDDIIRMAEDLTRILESMVAGEADKPLDFVPSLPDRGGPGRQERELAAAHRDRLWALASRRGVSTAAVMLAAFAALVHRVAMRGEFTVHVAPRRALAFALDADTEFGDLLEYTQARLDAAGLGRDGPGEPDETGGPDGNDGAHGPGNDSAPRLGFAFYKNGRAPGHDCRGYGLFCFVRETADGLLVRFEHDAGVLPEETARNWLAYYERVLEAVSEGEGL